MPASFVAILAIAAAAAAAAPQPAPAAVDVSLEALAATLGRAHALHRLCAGPADDLWRGRMQAMLVAERATPARRGRLVARFNAGYGDAAAEFTTCSSASRQALATTMAQGRTQAAARASDLAAAR